MTPGCCCCCFRLSDCPREFVSAALDAPLLFCLRSCDLSRPSCFGPSLPHSPPPLRPPSPPAPLCAQLPGSSPCRQLPRSTLLLHSPPAAFRASALFSRPALVVLYSHLITVITLTVDTAANRLLQASKSGLQDDGYPRPEEHDRAVATQLHIHVIQLITLSSLHKFFLATKEGLGCNGIASPRFRFGGWMSGC